MRWLWRLFGRRQAGPLTMRCLHPSFTACRGKVRRCKACKARFKC